MKNRVIVGFLFSISSLLILAFGILNTFFLPVILLILGSLFIFELQGAFQNQAFLSHNQLDLANYEVRYLQCFFIVQNIIFLLIVLFFFSSNIFSYYFLAFFFFSFLGILIYKNIKIMAAIANLLIFSMYIFLPFVSIAKIIRLPERGIYFFLLSIFSAWFTDTFAYFFGYLWGKKKMIPFISPNKTWLGAIGGIIGSVVFIFFYHRVYFIFNPDIKFSLNYLFLLMLGVGLGIFSQAGDIIASLLKRYLGIKDFSKVLQSHGGMLDRFDSVLFNWIFLSLFVSLVG